MTAALTRVLASLEAERLAPVPRASHAAAVDVDDLALVLDHMHQHTPRDRMTLPVAQAWDRLDKVIRCFADALEPARVRGAA